MSSAKQLDVSKALATASLFHFFHSAGNYCVMPFLTIYFRQLGLNAPLVGIVMGVKYIIYVLWAPLCSYLANNGIRRRILITTSLFLSVGAGITFVFIPPLSKDTFTNFCNVSQTWNNRLAISGDMALSSHDNTSFSLPESSQTTPLDSYLEMHLTHPPRTSENSEPTKKAIHVSYPSSINLTHKSKPSSSRKKILDNSSTLTSSTFSTATRMDSISADHALSGDGSEMPLTDSQPTVSSIHVLHAKLPHAKKVRDTHVKLSSPVYFLADEQKVFLMVLGAVIIWEIIAAPLDWTADDSLYEYLDFVDATDRHGKLWIWNYLGACMGCGAIVLLIDNFSCFIYHDVPRVSLHFFSYSTFMVISLLLSSLFPIHASKKSEHNNKTIKALGLIGSDGGIVLIAVTVFLTGVIGSTANNFLFWRMQDIGSSELYMGMSVAIALLSEMILYLFRNKLLKALSFKWTVALGLSCLAAQLLYYSFLWNSWSVLPIQLLSAFSNGALWWAINSQAEDVATPGTERSLQLVLHSLSYGFGSSVGSFSSGFVSHRFGLSVLYQACCLTLVLWIILFLLIQPRLPQLKKINYSRLLAADNSDMSDSEDEPERDWLVKAMKDENFNRKW
ncbi:major facilitator superfamily domain-containing protein 6-like [Bombina bombina]|uniref:major facilitator superfamily domain-containing protein 6-like n=1 Tax=Bombina bombina TaxID=8345 RepID=UPI00235A6440|nr:major facilitator superfamily domain-containing protein 6-like [Bombina bombina]